MKKILIKPIKETPEDFDAIESYLVRIFREEIYIPLLKSLGMKNPSKLVKNSIDDISKAILSGKISFYRGKFKGKFSAEVSKELKKLGAQWDRSQGCYSIPYSKLPNEIRQSISLSDANYTRSISNLNEKLQKISPVEIADKFKAEDLFEKLLIKTQDKVSKSLKDITIVPKLSSYQKSRISDEYTKNMQLYIRDFVEKETIELRQKVQEHAFTGARYEGLAKKIQDSYGVSQNKAKFLARQETSLLITKYKQTKYQEAGVNKYIWHTVIGSPNHPVRPMHKIHDGKEYSWDNPPIVDKEGNRKNPGQDYNCLPGDSLVTLDRPILKVFRRSYAGEATRLVTSNGVILNSTRNHPVLTERGWVSAHSVNVGDYVFNPKVQSIFGEQMHGKNIVASIEQIFDSLFFCSQVTSDVLSSSDFHGDVTVDKNIDVISVNRELMLSRISELFQSMENVQLHRTDSLILTKSPFFVHLNAKPFGSYSFMSLFSEIKTLLGRHLRHSDSIRFASTSYFNAGFFEHSSNHVSGDTVFDRYSKLTHPVLVILDSILNSFNSVGGFHSAFDLNSLSAEVLAQDIGRDFELFGDITQRHLRTFIESNRVVDNFTIDFSGHVYNLETKNNWFISNSLITHNCRCYAVPIVEF